jgi:ribose/xylose/arabinose/galactoside ABC-type transport system permease subunit
LVAAIVAVVILFSFTGTHFAEVSNALIIGRQTAALAIIAMGLGVVMISGGIDLSIGSAVSIASVVSALVARELGTGLGFLAGIGSGLVIGGTNGMFIAGAGLPPFIITLATLSAGASAALLLSHGLPVAGVPGSFDWLGTADVAGVPLLVVLALLIVALLGFIMRSTRFGRRLYATGGNERAAWLCAVNIRAMKYRAYLISGGLAAIGGVILSSRIASGDPVLGSTDILIQAVAAVLIGGVRLGGGAGSVEKIALAALFLTILTNGMNLSDVASFWQGVVTGAMVIFASLAEVYASRRLGPMGFVKSLFGDVALHDSGRVV